MKDTRYDVVAEQLNAINGPFEPDIISEALARIAFAVLPDWGEFEVPVWLVEGLRPLFARLWELSDSLKVDLLECLAQLYDSPTGTRPDFDLSELKANLDRLPVAALPYALAILVHDEQAAPLLERYVQHPCADVRVEAQAGLERLRRPRRRGPVAAYREESGLCSAAERKARA
jgi:hypothetical protein